jgi:hypothetical protein
MGGSVEIDRSLYCKLANEFNKDIIALVMEGHQVRLPEKMGAVSIKGKKIVTEIDEDLGRISNQAIDFNETKKLWARCPECEERKQRVYHLNEHSDGVRYKYFWSKDRMLVGNKLFYTMIFTRTNKRDLSHLIQDGKEYYVEPTKY